MTENDKEKPEEKIRKLEDALKLVPQYNQAQIDTMYREFNESYEELREQYDDDMETYRLDIQEQLKELREADKEKLEQNIEESIAKINALKAHATLEFSRKIQQNLENFQTELENVLELLSMGKADKITLTIYKDENGKYQLHTSAD